VRAVPFAVDFNIPQVDDWQTLLDAAGALGVKLARTNVAFWLLVERVAGAYDWSRVDEVVDGLLKRGVEPYVNIGLGNPLYAPGVDEGRRSTPLRTAESRRAWLAFLEAAARRYRGRVRCWELGNEPNHPHFWRPRPDPRAYAAYVVAAARGLRAGNPEARLIAGSVSGVALDFTRAFLAALPGAPGEHFDVFAYHPYRSVPERGYAEDVAALRATLRDGGFDGPIWQGECGYPSEAGCIQWHGDGPWSETIQAKHLLRRLLADWCAGAEVATWFLLVDFSTARDPSQGWGAFSTGTNSMGLLALETLRPKPAYRALQHLCALFDGAAHAGGDTLPDGARVEAFRAPSGRPLVAYWAPRPLAETPFHGWLERERVEGALLGASNPAAQAPWLLVDALTGAAQALPAGDLPLTDYPLVIAGRDDLALDG
jgi:hypothetical protein